MADQTSSGDGTGIAGSDGALGSRPSAPGAMNAALGRTSGDFATDSPAGFAAGGVRRRRAVARGR